MQGSLKVGWSKKVAILKSQVCPGLDEALRSCGLLLRQAMERAETQHQINGMDAHYYTILE